MLARLTLPFFCAVPLSAPMAEMQTPASAGPYSITSRTPNSQIVLDRNPNYHGARPSNFDRIVYRIGDSLDAAKQLVEQGAADYAVGGIPPTAYAEVNALYGPGSAAAASGRQRFFVNAQLGFSYIALNTSRPVFANQTLRQAVAYAIDRAVLVDQGGPFAGTPTDQYLPPGMPGSVDESIYPLRGDLAQAQALAASQGVTAATPVFVELYSSNRGAAPAQAQIVQERLAQVGINATIHLFDRVVQFEKTRTRGEPFDLTLDGWVADYNDPANILNTLLDGETITATGNDNLSYFDDPVFNARLDAAAQLSGPARYDTYALLEQDLVRAAPLVAISNYNRRDYFADRIGCQQYGIFGMNLASLCLRAAPPSPPPSGGGGGGSGAADLHVTGSAEPVSAPVGGTITWRLRVLDDKHYGPATGVYVDVELPAGVTLVLAQADRGPGCVAAGGQKLRCNLDWLSSDAPYGNVILVTNVTAAGELVLTATVGYSSADPNPADNTLVLKANTPAAVPPPVVSPPVVRPVFGKASALPPVPLAGKRMTFTLPVRRSDTGAPLTTGRMVCNPSVAGKPIKHTESFTAGKVDGSRSSSRKPRKGSS